MNKGDFIWFGVLCAITAILIVPVLRNAFVSATDAHPYLMGFLKFAILATMGEMLSLRILNSRWIRLAGLFPKVMVWGIIGFCIVLMFGLYSSGVAGAAEKELLISAPGFGGKLLQAFFISALMNLTFGPVFMAAHRISDTWIDACKETRGITVSMVLEKIDWQDFIRFVVGKTIPFFWIPAHTIVFMLPAQYRVIAAAYLSIALGLILAYARRRKNNSNMAGYKG